LTSRTVDIKRKHSDCIRDLKTTIYGTSWDLYGDELAAHGEYGLIVKYCPGCGEKI